MKNKILLLGHTGFVGSEIYSFLRKKKLKINCYSRKEKIINNKVYSNKISLKKLISKSNIIINCVGENLDLNKMESNNHLFVKMLLNNIRNLNKKKKLIHLSSCAIYGEYFHVKNFVINQHTKPKPISKYAKSKLAADKEIIKFKSKKLKYIILRPSQVIGKNMKARGFIHLAKFIKYNLFVYSSTKTAIRNYVTSEDLCKIVLKICRSNMFDNNIYLISRYSKLKDIVGYIRKKLNNKLNLDIVISKKILTVILFFLTLLKIKLPVSKEIIEGLSTTTKIKANIQNIYKYKLKNINYYLNEIVK